MKKGGAVFLLCALMLYAPALAENGRTVFVNPHAGKQYHAVLQCPSVQAALWQGMQEMDVYSFAASDYAGYRRCTVCFGELEDLNSPLAVGQLGENGIYYPLWQPSDTAEDWQERDALEETVDLNGDGTADRAVLCVFPDGEGTPEELIAGGSMAFLKVFIGAGDGTAGEEASFVSRGFTQARAGNGLLFMTRRGEAVFLVDCSFLVRREKADFEYTVYRLKNSLGISMADRRTIRFDRETKEEKLAPFGTALFRWTDGAELLLCLQNGFSPSVGGNTSVEEQIRRIFAEALAP